MFLVYSVGKNGLVRVVGCEMHWLSAEVESVIKITTIKPENVYNEKQ